MVGPVAWLALGFAVELSGGSDCPTPQQVQERLNPLLAPDATSTSLYRVRVERTDDLLSIELVDADGALLATRQLSAAASCAELAAAAAVVVATWEVELRARGTLGLPFDPRPEPPRPSLRVDLGAGLFGHWSGGSTVPAISADVAVSQGAWGAAGFLMGTGEHDQVLGGGRALWRRLSLGVGPRWTSSSPRWELGLSAQAMVAWMMLRGDGFERNRSDHSLDPGTAATVRVGLKSPGLYPWVGVTLSWWPLVRDVVVAGSSAGERLPQWEVLVGGGVSFSVVP